MNVPVVVRCGSWLVVVMGDGRWWCLVVMRHPRGGWVPSTPPGFFSEGGGQNNFCVFLAENELKIGHFR